MTIGRFTSPRTKSGFIRPANGPSSQNRHTQVPHTHRYHVTELGRQILPAILVAPKTTLKSLNTKAA